MITQLTIENFKCFKKQIIPLAPFTLLTGFNAAGKSTTIQSMLLGSQLARTGVQKKAVALNGELVKLGSVGDVLCSFGSVEGRTVSFEYSTGAQQSKLTLDASERPKIALPIEPQSTLLTSYEHLELLRDCIYISATRMGTLDVFPMPEVAEPIFADVGECGQFAPWWYDSFADEPITENKAHSNESAFTLRRQFMAWSGELFPGSEVNTFNLENTPLVRLGMRKGQQEAYRRPANIGYGLTYAFPILVAGLLAKPGQILIIDSPEAHLHPMGQSKMGYFLASMAAAGVQVILETHSDHVLNGMRVAVMQNKLNHEDAAIHFFAQSHGQHGQQPNVTSPHVNSKGQLSEWPQGFFDQSEKDLATLSGWG